MTWDAQLALMDEDIEEYRRQHSRFRGTAFLIKEGVPVPDNLLKVVYHVGSGDAYALVQKPDGGTGWLWTHLDKRNRANWKNWAPCPYGPP